MSASYRNNSRSGPADTDFDVAVAGFGPCGAVCTALLGSLGVRTLAVERARGVYDKPRAFALDHEIMRVFQNLGLADAVAKHTAAFTPSEYYGVEGQLIKRLGSVPPPYPLGWPPNMVFTQPPVEQALRDHAAACAGVEVALGTELEDFEQTDEVVTMRLRDDAGRERTVRSRYLVGCDGASSTVRKQLGIEYEDLEFDEPWLVVDLMLNERGLAKLPAVSIQYCDPSRPATYLIGPGAHRRWEIMLLPGEDRARMESEAEVWRLLSRWIGPGDAALWRVASYRFHALVAREWRRGRVFLAGDAAHQQPPFTGQGMCQGVRDVANLSWKLRKVLDGAAGDSLLDSYGRERGPHVRRLTSTIKEIGRLICERDPAAARARDAKLLEAAGGKIETMPRQQLIPRLDGGFLSRVPHPANGSLFPQPRIRHDGSEILLDDITGGGFRIIAGEGFPVSQLRRMDLAERVGAKLVRMGADEGCCREMDAVVANWFKRNACAAAIVRPDHYVYGVAADAAGLDRILEEIDAQLQMGGNLPMRLRSVELQVPQAATAAEFLENLWGLVPAGQSGATRFFRGTGDHPYIFSIAEASAPAITAVTFAGTAEEVERAQARAKRENVLLNSVSAFDVPGGGSGFEAQGPEGQVYRLIAESERPARLQDRDKPVQITHAVLNTVDVASAERFAVEVLGFQISDRTRHMTFVRCNRKHHAVAYAHSDAPSLNHVAFEMQDIDAVMRGLGRMRDGGIDTVWGPGRHGPGNNVFSYFISPFGAIIEYTAEVSEVGDDYKVGAPEDWKWPPGRIDHWGVSKKDVARTSVAERAYRFAPR